MKKVQIFNSMISCGTKDDFIDSIFKLTERKEASYVCFANVHMITEAHRDKDFNLILNKADIAAADGKPVSLFIKYFKKFKQDRICGMDFFPVILKEAEQKGKSVFFYGSTENVLKKIIEKSRNDFPSLKIAGYHSPPFRELSMQEDQTIIDSINDSGADFLFVSLGCPKQEKWMAEHASSLNVCMLGVGQAFMTYPGLEKRLPVWMRDWSLEWLYRLYQEPNRLWKRYLYTNSLFVFLGIRYLFGKQAWGEMFISSKKRRKIYY